MRPYHLRAETWVNVSTEDVPPKLHKLLDTVWLPRDLYESTFCIERLKPWLGRTNKVDNFQAFAKPANVTAGLLTTQYSKCFIQEIHNVDGMVPIQNYFTYKLMLQIHYMHKFIHLWVLYIISMLCEFIHELNTFVDLQSKCMFFWLF